MVLALLMVSGCFTSPLDARKGTGRKKLGGKKVILELWKDVYVT